jgi:hypothetical protein
VELHTEKLEQQRLHYKVLRNAFRILAMIFFRTTGINQSTSNMEECVGIAFCYYFVI